MPSRTYGNDRRIMDTREVRRQTVTGIDDADNQHHAEGKNSDFPRTFAELSVEARYGDGPQLGWWRRSCVGAVAIGDLLVLGENPVEMGATIRPYCYSIINVEGKIGCLRATVGFADR